MPECFDNPAHSNFIAIGWRFNTPRVSSPPNPLLPQGSQFLLVTRSGDEKLPATLPNPTLLMLTYCDELLPPHPTPPDILYHPAGGIPAASPPAHQLQPPSGPPSSLTIPLCPRIPRKKLAGVWNPNPQHLTRILTPCPHQSSLEMWKMIWILPEMVNLSYIGREENSSVGR